MNGKSNPQEPRGLEPRAFLVKLVLAALVFLPSVLLPSTTAQADDQRPPNIVLILADDLGWSDLHCYGHPYHSTPNLDRLAAEGLRFTNGYSPAPICSAARASILTGKAVPRLGFEFVTKNEPGLQIIDVPTPLTAPRITVNLPLAEVTVAERLAARGYQTAFFGKWHVNQHYQRRYLAWHPEFGPKKQGFEFATEDFGDHPYAWGKTKPKDTSNGVMPHDSLINSAAEFIQSQRDVSKPFFAMASMFYVHTPVKNRCRWLVEKYERALPARAANYRKRLEYAAFVETLDHHVGTILKAIDASGQRENTLVIFMSDNGGHPEFCSNAPLRGSKWNLYEGGIRVPIIARWPDQIAPGAESGTPIIGYDLLPTMVDIACGKASTKTNDTEVNTIDGVSIRPVFTNDSWSPRRSLIWHFPYYHPEKTFSSAIDEIGVDDFATSKTRPQSAIRTGQYKMVHFAEDDRVELYDLAHDISEQNDLSAKLPDIARNMRTELQRQLTLMNARRAERAKHP